MTVAGGERGGRRQGAEATVRRVRGKGGERAQALRIGSEPEGRRGPVPPPPGPPPHPPLSWVRGIIGWTVAQILDMWGRG